MVVNLQASSPYSEKQAGGRAKGQMDKEYRAIDSVPLKKLSRKFQLSASAYTHWPELGHVLTLSVMGVW